MYQDELDSIISELSDFPNVKVVGLMGMATNTKDEEVVDGEFKVLKSLFDTYSDTCGWNTLSMGMSGDYKLAIQNGSTHVRIGSAIFGARNYS